MSTNSGLSVVKIGGNVIDDEDKLQGFLEKFSALPGKKILVHGGGKIATRMATDLGLQPKLVEGRRITDAEMLKVAIMVYAGLTNKSMVALLQKYGCDAIGLSGADGNAIKAIKRPVREIDYGFVGDILADSINETAVKRLLESGFTPVFSAITHDGYGQLLNTNADTIASALAVGLAKLYDVSLLYCFEKDGVLRNVEDPHSLIESISSDEFTMLKEQKVIYDGMIPKLHNAFDAIGKGVRDVFIGNADNLHHFQQQKFGTRLFAR